MEFSLMSSLEEGIKQAFDIKNVISSILKAIDAYISRENTVNNRDVKRLNSAQLCILSNNYQESLLSVVIKEFSDSEAECFKQKLNLINQLQCNLQKPYADFIKNFPPLSKKLQKLKTMCISVRSINSKLNTVIANESQNDKKLNRTSFKSESSDNQLRMDLDSAQGEFIASSKELKRLIFNTIKNGKQMLSRLTCIIEYHIDYHKSCVDVHRMYVEKIKTKISEDTVVFGVNLEDHLSNQKCEISHVISDCICYLSNYMDTKGLFRINAQESKVKKLMSIFNTGLPITESFITDEHTVGSTLKRYLAQLPIPLVPFSAYNNVRDIIKMKSGDSAHKLKLLLDSIPRSYYVNLRYVVKFLTEIVQFAKDNMMDVNNIGIVFGPCIVRQDNNPEPDLSFCDKEAVKLMVNEFDKIFPDGCVINKTNFYRFSCTTNPKLKKTNSGHVPSPETSSLLGSNSTSRNDSSHNSPCHFTNPAAYSELGKPK